MAGFMDYFTGGTGGTGFDMFGGDASGMNDLLTAQQQEAIKRQSMLAMAAQLLQAGGRSTQRTSLGQALGQGVMAGQQAQEKGTTGAVNQMLLRSKLDEAKRAQAIQGFIQRGELFMPEGELWTGPMREIESYQYGIKEQRDDFIDCIFDLWDLPKPAPPSRVAAAESAWGVAPMPGQPRRFGMREVARRRA